MKLLLLSIVLTAATATQARSVETEKRSDAEDTVCFPRLDCFPGGDPWDTYTKGRPTNKQPESPDDVQTKFLLYTRTSQPHPQAMDARHPNNTSYWPSYDPSRPTKFVVHGYRTKITKSRWMKELTDELLTYGDYNVVIVDWQEGNQGMYDQAVGNTRLVGAQIADLIGVITRGTAQTAKDFHVIGHSLGAHIGGYVGELVKGLGRISGLDPAGPYFRNTASVVRLDASDAAFVDIIHTDAKRFTGLSMRRQMGHVDYYPNRGYNQPGCPTNMPRDFIRIEDDKTTSQDDNDLLACSHGRAWKFYTESINSNCPFLAFPCGSEDDFTSGKCQSCAGDSCSVMGFHSRLINPRTHTRYFLTTSDHLPFCQYPLGVTVTLSGSHTNEHGYLKVKVYGVTGTTDWIALNSAVVNFKPGKSYTYTLGSNIQIGAVSGVEVGFHHKGAWTNPWKWTMFGLRNPKLMIQEVDVQVLASTVATNHRFCISGGAYLETDTTIKATVKC